jgi:DNA helicase-2/ATP-dependent DNA helicase PcrA
MDGMARDYVLQGFQAGGDLRIDYAAELNEQQYAAVTAPPGPALVLAGAGSGKTRTLTYRVAYLLEHGVPPDRVLLLTFTNKAAREMMRRVSELLGEDLPQLWGGTFHSIGARVLRLNAESLGFRPDFTILDREDSEVLIKSCVGSVGVDSASTPFPKPEVLADLFSRAANERKTVARIVEARHRGMESAQAAIERVAVLYTERKRQGNLMDFDDLLALWVRLLEENREVRERYQRRFQFILVDEYQDTNQIQSDLIDLLAQMNRHVMAVGDDSQSIYSWRGANYRNILDFPRRYPDARVFKIEVNYRSTPEILAVANAAIASNTDQFAKRLTAARKPGTRPGLVPCEDAQQQAAFVAQRIADSYEEGIPLREIAVLYRSHFHALELQLELTRRNIPFVITSGIRFFEQAHIKDVSAWLKLVANPADELAFKRIALLLPGVGPKAAEKLWAAYSDARASAAPAPAAGESALPPSESPSVPVVAPLLMAAAKAVPKKAVAAWANCATTVAQIETPPAAGNPGAMIRLVVEAFYADYAEDNFANARNRLDDLEQLGIYAGQFTSLSEFLTQLSLLGNAESEAEQKSKEDDERVRLSTVHQAKGLEYRVVFVVMLCEALFPSARSVEDPQTLEEERRLFYVAVTRAEDELYLCYPLLRFTQAQGMMMLERSRFIDEVPRELLEEWNLRPARSMDFGGAWPREAPPHGEIRAGEEDPF